ncbi:MAG TPA: methyltransferase domain-containing protein [Gemmatimonadales bacterium]
MIALTPSPLGREALDDLTCEPAVVRATLADIARANDWFGARRAAAFALRRLLADVTPPPTPLLLLDLAAGSGDIAQHLAAAAAADGVTLRPVALDRLRTAAHRCRDAGLPAIVADAAAIPIPDRSVDIVLVSQFLHHLDRDAAVAVLRRLNRLARLGVIVLDERRSFVAVVGFWIGATLLRFHPVSRHDGVLSIRRSFDAPELASVIARAGVAAAVHRRPGFRLVAAWKSGHAHHRPD